MEKGKRKNDVKATKIYLKNIIFVFSHRFFGNEHDSIIFSAYSSPVAKIKEIKKRKINDTKNKYEKKECLIFIFHFKILLVKRTVKKKKRWSKVSCTFIGQISR